MSKAQSALKKREKIDPFSLSFLDIISCGFGAVVILILIFRFDPLSKNSSALIQKAENSIAFEKVLAAAEIAEKIRLNEALLTDIAAKRATSVDAFNKLRQQLDQLNQKLLDAKTKNNEREQVLTALKDQIDQSQLIENPNDLKTNRDEEAGGILVDRDYVIFIVDTSGSMREIWGQVATQMKQILKQHPRVKGIQVMNDNGSYLFSAYQKRWITDTPKMRQRILRLFKLWSSTSNSSPAEGLVRALTDFQNYTKHMSIYVLGDDYSGSDFDGVIESIKELNVGGARINAINFISPRAATDRFSILMREICLDNNGTLVTM